jgi:hypothetical protein
MYRFIILLLVPMALSAQKVVKPDIQYVTITDTALINEIKKYIKEEGKTDALFAKGKGYINVDFTYLKPIQYSVMYIDDGPVPDIIDTVYTYGLTHYFHAVDKKENKLDDFYPSYYSFVDGRLICLGSVYCKSGFNDFGLSEKSKKKYRRIVERYLEPVGSESRKITGFDHYTTIYFVESFISRKRYFTHFSVTSRYPRAPKVKK